MPPSGRSKKGQTAAPILKQSGLGKAIRDGCTATNCFSEISTYLNGAAAGLDSAKAQTKKKGHKTKNTKKGVASATLSEALKTRKQCLDTELASMELQYLAIAQPETLVLELFIPINTFLTPAAAAVPDLSGSDAVWQAVKALIQHARQKETLALPSTIISSCATE
ncbi:Uu.00g070830.m01.CDS01 [Anthostomella pinea]|uniref:Uu.00g070830.m01.CDS01 n=1 Tax=Anthostomella pinea TaxID=933095 RepID=A0AAI8VVZ8_9PEZI|nr:Uu.00g070830.m01.CDS01 [Anthostomella pinea]